MAYRKGLIFRRLQNRLHGRGLAGISCVCKSGLHQLALHESLNFRVAHIGATDCDHEICNDDGARCAGRDGDLSVAT